MEKGEQIVESYEHNSSPIEISRHAKNVCNVEAPESIMSMVTHTTENNSLFLRDPFRLFSHAPILPLSSRSNFILRASSNVSSIELVSVLCYSLGVRPTYPFFKMSTTTITATMTTTRMTTRQHIFFREDFWCSLAVLSSVVPFLTFTTDVSMLLEALSKPTCWWFTSWLNSS